jgi:hypothetical protein
MSEPEGAGGDWLRSEELEARNVGRSRLKGARRRASKHCLDPDVLAEFRSGLITGRRGARIAAHLAACDRCTAVGDELAGVSALLAAVPAPAMPDRVAQRLDAVLAAEAAKKDYSERASGNRPGDRKPSRRAAGSHGWRLVSLRVLAPAAVVLLAAGGYGLSQLAGGSGPQATSASAGRAVRPTRGFAAAAAPAPAPASGVPSAKSLQLSPANYPLVTSRTNFLPGTLRQQLETALQAAAESGTAPAASATVRACVQSVAGGVTPVLVESARFEGQPAIIIVVRTGPGDTVWVAGPGCSSTHRDERARTTLTPGISGP